MKGTGGGVGLGENIKASPADSLVPIKLGSETIDFLIDSGTTHLVVTSCKGPLSKTTIPIVGEMGKRTLWPFLQPVENTIGGTKLTHKFLYMAECPLPLLGQVLLCELNAQVTFSENSVQLHIPHETAWKSQIFLLADKTSEKPENNIPDMVLNVVIPLVYTSKKPGKAKNVTPLKIELSPGVIPVRVNQYPIRLEACKALEPLISFFIQYGLLRECQSEFNTPVLPVKKPRSQEYRLVEDLKAINKITVDIHHTVPNPYTLLASVSETNAYFTVLDLKDAFFCILVDEQSQTIFTFECVSPLMGRKMHLCWTVLPQGLKTCPTLCGNVLAKELEKW